MIVGVERGWQLRDEPEGHRTAGVRTFTLIGLAGGLAGELSSLSQSAAPWIVVLAILTLVFAWFSHRENIDHKTFSVTGVIAAMVVFLLGVLAAMGDMRVAAAGGVIVAGLLASRTTLHRTVSRLTWTELRSALLLLAMTAVVLPILPNRTVDIFNSLNPRELWLLMTLTAAVSYVGYIAMKVAGPDKGPPVAGLAGGLASSTAVTIAMARLSRQSDGVIGLGSGVALASMVSLMRASLLAASLEPSLTLQVGVPAAAAALVFGVAGAAPLFRSPAAGAAAKPIGVPFELAAVLLFGLVLAAVTFGGAWVARQAGEAGVYAFAAISGLLDVDAITLSSARSVDRGVAVSLAASAILIAFAANAAQRVVFAWMFGSRAFALRFSVITAAAIAAGVLAWLIA